MTDTTEWYVAIDGRAHGPVSFADIKAAAAAGEMTNDQLLWNAALADWRPAIEIHGLLSSDPTKHAEVSMPAAAGESHEQVAHRLGVWLCLALAGMHALGAIAVLVFKLGFLSHERLSADQAYVAAINNMAVAVAFLTIAYLYDAKKSVFIPVFGVLLFGAEIGMKVASGQFAIVWLLAYTCLGLMFLASMKAAGVLRGSALS